MKMLLTALLTGSVLVACDRNAPPPAEIVGSWVWTYGDNGSLGGRNETLGSGCVLELEGEWQFRFRCADEDAVGTYSIGGDAAPIQAREPGPLIIFSTELPILQESSWVLSTDGDTLFLRTLAYDDFDHVFVKGPPE